MADRLDRMVDAVGAERGDQPPAIGTGNSSTGKASGGGARTAPGLSCTTLSGSTASPIARPLAPGQQRLAHGVGDAGPGLQRLRDRPAASAERARVARQARGRQRLSPWVTARRFPRRPWRDRRRPVLRPGPPLPRSALPPRAASLFAVADVLVGSVEERRDGAADVTQTHAVDDDLIGADRRRRLADTADPLVPALYRPRKLIMSSWSMPSPDTPTPPISTLPR